MTWIGNTSLVQTGRCNLIRREVPIKRAHEHGVEPCTERSRMWRRRGSEGLCCPAQICRQRRRFQGLLDILVDRSKKVLAFEAPRLPAVKPAAQAGRQLHALRSGIQSRCDECPGLLVWEVDYDEDALEMASHEAMKYRKVLSSFRLGKSMKGEILRRLK